MGLFDRLVSQFIEIIEWTDDSSDTVVYRFPVYAKEIKMGAQLTVREGQAAVFVNEGKIADVFQPGRYTLTTQNMPILSTLKGWKYGFESPFKAEVYFVATRVFTDLKWGTQNPVMLRDPEFGPIRLRAFGTYAMRAVDPGALLKHLVGTDGLFQVEEVSNQLRNILVATASQVLGSGKFAALDFMARSAEVNSAVEAEVNSGLREWGIAITRFLIENVSLPPEVEQALDTRSKMAVLGDLGKFTQFQTAQAIGDAAKNPGGGAGAGMGLGAGIAMGQQMAATMGAMQQPTAAAPQGGAPTVDVRARLEQLKKLYEDKLITAEEYEAKRKELIAKL